MSARCLAFALFLLAACSCRPREDFSSLPVPTEAQLRWQQMELILFCHFGPNTFSGAEWGDGTEAEDLFNPTDLDCRQWAATARAAGFKGIIVTAKHHDGFCLWPNPESTHTVAQSRWREGKGDVLAELSAACREYGLGFGVYISPWDRHDPRYGTDAYNEAFTRTLADVHGGRYGTVFEQWFDGACGEGPDGRQQTYDWDAFIEVVRRLQPQAMVFSDVGPDCRWVGSETGFAGETNWSTLSPEGFSPGAGAPPLDTLRQGNARGTHWIPAEADVSIRPGWFWRASEDTQLKTVDELMDIYYGSVGRNAVLLLNVPPDSRGRLPAGDSLRLMEFRERRETVFGKDLAAGIRQRSRGTEVSLRFPSRQRFNLVCLQENIAEGQRVAAFHVDILDGGAWKTVAEGTTIGYKRILRLPETVSAEGMRICVDRAYGKPRLLPLSLYLDPFKGDCQK